MGYAVATLVHPFGTYFNPASLGNLEYSCFSASYNKKFYIDGFDQLTLSAVHPFNRFTIGLSAFQFGDDLYHEQSLSLSLANKLGLASLGIRTNYQVIYIENYGSKGIITIDFGGIAQLTPNFSFGAYIRNINQNKFSESTDLGVINLNAGLQYQPLKAIILAIESEKSIDTPAIFKAGLAYEIHERITLRTGINTQPLRNYAGAGFANGKLKIDYSVSYQTILGLDHQLSLILLVSKPKRLQ